jgi:hypothetical protein
MIHLRKDTARQFSGHHVAKPRARAHIAATMITYVIVAKAMRFVEGAP